MVKVNCLNCGIECILQNGRKYCSKKCFHSHFKMSPENRKKISLFFLGRKLSKDVRLKMSIAKRNMTPQNKINIGLGRMGLKCPQQTLDKISGENNYRWIKDRTKLKKDPRKDLDTQYKYWRKEIRRRDYNKCKLSSNECKGRLETHHIFDWINYPELRYVTTNGITLCHFHHPRGREEEKRMIPIFQELLSVSKE